MYRIIFKKRMIQLCEKEILTTITLKIHTCHVFYYKQITLSLIILLLQ